ncbi:MAG: hypothetical protein ABSH40_08440 [Bryobacteraceae bacterium]|jgi:hypothetical protein
MATKKKSTSAKRKELIVLVPSKWGLAPADVKKLQVALEPKANATLAKLGGAIHVVTGVTNGVNGNGNGNGEDES